MRKLKMGMVAVENAFIGAIHRIAKIDGLLNCIVVLWLNSEISKESGKALFLPEERLLYLSRDVSYGSFAKVEER
jgi:hypothetical protein